MEETTQQKDKFTYEDIGEPVKFGSERRRFEFVAKKDSTEATRQYVAIRLGKGQGRFYKESHLWIHKDEWEHFVKAGEEVVRNLE